MTLIKSLSNKRIRELKKLYEAQIEQNFALLEAIKLTHSRHNSLIKEYQDGCIKAKVYSDAIEFGMRENILLNSPEEKMPWQDEESTEQLPG